MNIDINYTKGMSKADTFVSEIRHKTALDIQLLSHLVQYPHLAAPISICTLIYCPFQEKLMTLIFNKLVTDSALDNYILTLSDPYQVLYLGSKLIEQNFHLIFCRGEPNSPVKNLSVSKHFGVFFTPRIIASRMVKSLEQGRGSTILLDPCAGAGVLLGEALIRWKDFSYENYQGYELDKDIVFWGNKILNRVASLVGFDGLVGLKLGDGLKVLMSASKDKQKIRPDIIINPPFGRLRTTRDRSTNAETKLNSSKSSDFENIIEETKERSKALFEAFPELKLHKGIPEYSKIFLHACALNAKNGSQVSFIGPDTWLSGRQTADIRNKLISDSVIKSVLSIRESVQGFATVNQHMALVYMPGSRSEHLSLSEFGNEDKCIAVPYEDIKSKGKDFVGIPRLSNKSLSIYRKLDKLDKFGDIIWLSNLRGEVDQSIQKHLILEDKTSIKMVRGVHVEQFKLAHSSNEKTPSYVNEKLFSEFIFRKPKEAGFLSERIVGRQCSYAQQKNRLVFCRVPTMLRRWKLLQLSLCPGNL